MHSIRAVNVCVADLSIVHLVVVFPHWPLGMATSEASKGSESAHTTAQAAAEVSAPGTNTTTPYECPFCVVMRKGGCEEVFKAFMECGEKADKGQGEMADCLTQFEQLHLCMEKNKKVFDGLLQEMWDEEQRAKAAAAGTEAGAAANSSRADHSGSSSSELAAVHAAKAADAVSSSTVQQQQQQKPAAAGAAQHNSSSTRHRPHSSSVAGHSTMATGS